MLEVLTHKVVVQILLQGSALGIETRFCSKYWYKVVLKVLVQGSVVGIGIRHCYNDWYQEVL